MIQLIAPGFHQNFRDALTEMHRLRCRVFRDRLDWAVELHGDQEIDRFDLLQPHYLLLYAHESVVGTVRFLPTTGPTMLTEAFPELLGGSAAPADPAIWESSRFALDLPASRSARRGGLAVETYVLFAGMIEFGLLYRLTKIVTVTDARMMRILKRAAWPLELLGVMRQIGSTTAVAGYLEVSLDALAAVRAAGALTEPALWLPALAAA